MAGKVSRDNLINVGFEWFRQQFRSSKDVFPKIFTEVPLNHYLALHYLEQRLSESGSKVYLKDVAKELGQPIQKISPMVQGMQDLGLVTWKHDRSGTFITISEDGKLAMERQQDILSSFIEKCISIYGYEKLVTLVQYRNEFNDTMEKVLADL